MVNVRTTPRGPGDPRLGPMTAVTTTRRASDLVLPVVLALLGLVEIWLPMESVMGEGSPVVSTVAWWRSPRS